MASSHIFIFILSISLVHISVSSAQPSFRPSAITIPITKDSSTLQYITKLNQRTPLVPLNLVLDLGGKYQWLDCDTNYVSSTYRPVPCNSAKCNLARSDACGGICIGPPRPGCNNNTCGVLPDNTITRIVTRGPLSEDLISLNSKNGSNPGPLVQINRFTFSCAHPFLLEGLAKGVSGMAGLGRNGISLPTQFAAAFSFRRKFGICLSSGTGIAYFGDYIFPPGLGISDSLSQTPLFLNPVSTSDAFVKGEPSADYFIGVNSIKIDGEPISVNSSLLKIDDKGKGGTKISTVNPYTVLESSIYKAVIKGYDRAATARNMSRVAAVAPFEICFKASDIFSIGTREGPDVPKVTLVLQSEKVTWDIVGFNLMVRANSETFCLGFLDGGSSNSRTSIVIGGSQIEDNLLQFDLAASTLAFSSTLLSSRTTCSNFF